MVQMRFATLLRCTLCLGGLVSTVAISADLGEAEIACDSDAPQPATIVTLSTQDPSKHVPELTASSVAEKANGADGQKKQLMDISKVQTTETREQRMEGVHSDAFQTAYDALDADAALKRTILDDWLAANSILDAQAQRDAKAHELGDHQGKSAKAWWQTAWASIKRAFENLFFKTETRLTNELAGLEAALAAMKAEKAALEAEVQEAIKATNDHKGDAHDILAGLKVEVAAMTEDITSYRAGKAAEQAQHAKAVADLTAEHLAAVDVETALVKQVHEQIHEKRYVYYNLTATCAQLETKGTAICNKCDGSSRACGDDCISTDALCHVVPGCACDDGVGHDLHEDFKKVKEALEDTIKLHDTTINTKTEELAQTEKGIKKIEADKLAVHASYEKEKHRLVLLMQSLTSEKTTAEKSKVETQQKLAEETQASEDAIAKLKAVLETKLTELQASHKQLTESKQRLLAAQAASMKALLDNNAIIIGDWEAKILNAETEKARLQKEAHDLSEALANSK